MKNNSRKAFNFYLSYFDVYQELSDKDKLIFIDALLNRQFYGVEPTDLKGMVSFAYISQKHNIDAQIEGFENKTKTKLTHPKQGGSIGGKQGGKQGGSVQEKGKEKEKEQNVNRTRKPKFDSEDYKHELWDYLLEYCEKNNLDVKKVKNEALKAYEYYKELGWKNSNNKKIINLKSTIRNNWLSDLSKFSKDAKAWDW